MLILGIETSCDETAAAVVADGRRVLSSVVATQFESHAAYGGVVPEIAARRHLENILPVIQGALDQAGVSLQDLDGLAVTQGPGLVGALVIGMAAAKALAFTHKLPLAGVHHLQAHILAAFLTETAAGLPLRGPGGLRRPHQSLPGGPAFWRWSCWAAAGTTPRARPSTRWPSSCNWAIPAGSGSRPWPPDGQPRGHSPAPAPQSRRSPSPSVFSGLKTAVGLQLKKTSGDSHRPRGPGRPGRQLPGSGGGLPGQPGLAGPGADRLRAPGGLRRGGGQRPPAPGAARAGRSRRAPSSSCRPRPSAATTPPWWPPWATSCSWPAKRLDLDARRLFQGMSHLSTPGVTGERTVPGIQRT